MFGALTLLGHMAANPHLYMSSIIPAGFRELHPGEKILVGDCYIDSVSGHLVPSLQVGLPYGPYIAGVTSCGHCKHVRAVAASVAASVPAETPWRDVADSTPGEKDFPVWVHCVPSRRDTASGVRLLQLPDDYTWVGPNVSHWKPAKADIPTAPRILTQAEKDEAEKDEAALEAARREYDLKGNYFSGRPAFFWNAALKWARSNSVSSATK